MSVQPLPREAGVFKRGLIWLLLLGPFFFVSYGLANWITGQRDDVASLVFAWEAQMPLWPWSIVPYWSIDLLYGLSFLLCRSHNEADRHALRLLSTQLLCVAGFLLWPLRFTFERPELQGVFGWMFDVLMGFDKPFNQAPSLHIALLVVLWSCYARHVQGFWRWPMHLWFTLIGVSVLTTWQHHFIDVPSGALAGWLCVWLWPDEGRSPLLYAQFTKQARQWRLAALYALGALLCGVPAFSLGGTWLWLLWPACALLLVALNYTLFGAAGFQKRADGRLSPAARWLFAPYLLGAWLNSRLWTRRQPLPNEICAGVWLGRIPSAAELAASRFAAVLDLSAELSMRDQGRAYCSLPVLDLTALNAEQCLAAARTIEALRQPGPLLVCCALGYSRSASAVAAWLLRSGRAQDVDTAIAMLRAARPTIILGAAQREILAQLANDKQPASAQPEVAHAY